MADTSNFFKVLGGSLYADDPTYAERDADAELFAALRDGEFCYVLNSRQMGKSSLAVRTIDRLWDEDFDCVYLDLSKLEAKIDPAQWYGNIELELLNALDLEEGDEASLARVSPLVRLSRTIEDVVLPEIDRGLAIFIDEIDSVLGLDFNADDLFAFIRWRCSLKGGKQDGAEVVEPDRASGSAVAGESSASTSPRTSSNTGSFA